MGISLCLSLLGIAFYNNYRQRTVTFNTWSNFPFFFFIFWHWIWISVNWISGLNQWEQSVILKLIFAAWLTWICIVYHMHSHECVCFLTFQFDFLSAIEGLNLKEPYNNETQYLELKEVSGSCCNWEIMCMKVYTHARVKTDT